MPTPIRLFALFLGLAACARANRAATPPNRLTFCEYLEKIGVKDDRCSRKVRQIEDIENQNGRPNKWAESGNEGPMKRIRPRFLIATIWRRVEKDDEGIQSRLQRDRERMESNLRTGENNANNEEERKQSQKKDVPLGQDEANQEENQIRGAAQSENSIFNPVQAQPIFRRTDFGTKSMSSPSDQKPQPDSTPNPTVELTNNLNQYLNHENGMLKIKIFKLKRKQRRLRAKVRLLKWAVALLQKREEERKHRPKVFLAKSERLTTALFSGNAEAPVVAASAHLEPLPFRRSRHESDAPRHRRLQAMLLKVQSKKLFAYAVLRK
uniref:Uncharacterized protein n=1 Tax=Bursaphelenchus xylophilus TaxID=6326 RepID=A0A1I7RTA2_BURXY